MTSARSLSGSRAIARLTVCSIVLSIALFCGPALAYAADSAPGGNVASNSVNQAQSAFGGGASVTLDGTTMTITLNDDIALQAAVVFTQGSAGDKIIMDLNGHAITGAMGVAGNDGAAAVGKNAIEFYPVAYDLEIKGPGSVTGGQGGIYENANGYQYGMEGGMAVCIRGVSTEQFYGGLEYGLAVTGGAVLKGGDGASLSKTQWQYSFERYADNPIADPPSLSAGDGGIGVGQFIVDVDPNNIEPAAYPAYARIDIVNGAVEGGAGGDVDWSGVTPTVFALMNNALSQSVMQGKSVRNAASELGGLMSMRIGSGGDGICVGVGRKFVFVSADGSVAGGDCGAADFGDGKAYNRFGKGTADAGDGISVYGDIGLTNDSVDFTSWETKTKDSDDMGMLIEGAVHGGNSPNAYALNEDACDAGAGISLHGETRYGNDSDWGIISIGGTVAGGNAGTAISGDGGIGGPGLVEAYTKGNDQSFNSPYGTDYYIVNGTVTGGNGGTAYGSKATAADTVYATMVYSPALSDSGAFGPGGNGMSFGHYRENVMIAGSGTVCGGDAGNTVNRGSGGASASAADAIYLYPEDRIDTFTVLAGTVNGGEAQELNVDKISVKASMSSFSGQPTSDTQLSCTFDKPSGYSGAVYIQWVGVCYPIISYSGDDYAGFPGDIESTGSDYTSFKLLNNEAYRYLAYPTYESQPDLGMYSYNYDIATVDRFSDVANVQQKKQVYCYVMLEDGSWGKSNVMEFTTGWNGGGSGGGDDEPSAEDQAAADNVQGQINALVTDDVTLSDTDLIAEIRAEYNALTDKQKALVDTTKLDMAEARIEELNQAEADNVISLIENLPSKEEMAGMDADELAAAKEQIEAAVVAYNALTDYQKSKASSHLAYFESVIADYEEISGSPIDEEIAPADSRIALTVGMVSVENTTYNGSPRTPKVTVKADGTTLVEGTDYAVVYENNTNAGDKAVATVTGEGNYSGTVSKNFTIAKANNSLKVSGKTGTVKAKKVKKKAQSLKVSKVVKFTSKGQGTLSYKKKSGNKKIAINKKTGKVTVKKGLKKGTYKVKVAIKAAGNGNYNAKTVNVTFKVKVK